MSEIKIGDKVKFLNESGGGIVARLIDSRTVGVLIEDGFEIPTMISELVVLSSTDRAARFFEDHYNLTIPKADDLVADPEEDRITALAKNIVSDRKAEEIWLAFVPHDQKWLITGQLDVLMINNSSFDLLYNIYHKTPLNHYQGIDYGNVFPDSSILLATINREQVTHWSEGVIQFLFHKEQITKVVPPFNAEFKIDGKKFFKEGNYRNHQVIKEKGIVVKVLSLNEYFNSVSERQVFKENEQPAAGEKPEKSFIYRFQVQPGEAEIDLHIHELMEDPGNLANGEILEFQTKYFLKCLDAAMMENFQKLTVIHGVGNGVLKNVVADILKKQEGISFTDAPMFKYGAGAIEIRLHKIRNR